VSGAADKVTVQHLARRAYLYVRQSSMRQVIENTTSTERQYALRQRAVALGWPADQVVVVDDDLGQSGASAEGREGFQRLVAEVGMGHAGIVLGLEVSRLARNSADWHRLLEICGLTHTLICDEDGLYDPIDYSDRLVLGLKGTISEAELHLLRSRLRGGILARARTGDLALPLPIGLVYDPAERVVLDPDTAVQGAVRHLFATFTRTGSARATVAAFAAEGLRFPRRTQGGSAVTALVWVPLTHWHVVKTLHNPRYAGAFAYGRNRHVRLPGGGHMTHALPRDQWTSLILDAHPGYITWEDFEANQARLMANAQAHGFERRSPPREGPALLQGLVVCGRCGRRMTVRYHMRKGVAMPEYLCQGDAVINARKVCQVIPGAGIDEAVGRLLVETMTPLALEVALAVADELEVRAGEADGLRRAVVERARYEADLARRRYLAVDPNNRLVADTLEADWNQALRHLNAAQEDYERQRETARPLQESQRKRVLALAGDFPALWADPNTPQRERKRMVALLLEDVTLLRDETTISVQVRLRGGQATSMRLAVPLSAGEARRTPAEVITAIDRLLDDHTDAEVAAILNERGLCSGEGLPFDRQRVKKHRFAYGLKGHAERLGDAGLLSAKEMASTLGICRPTLNRWHRAGLVTGERANDAGAYLYYPPGPNPPAKRRGVKLDRRRRPPEGGTDES
jgi:DNA invertase Pin-like site-specific DNA recombinase